MMLLSVGLCFLVIGNANLFVTGAELEAPRNCSENFFLCQSDGRCIPDRWKCDGDQDCTEGEDENLTLCAPIATTQKVINPSTEIHTTKGGHAALLTTTENPKLKAETAELLESLLRGWLPFQPIETRQQNRDGKLSPAQLFLQMKLDVFMEQPTGQKRVD